MPDVREYVDPNGRSHFAEWFDDLEARAAARVVTAKKRSVDGENTRCEKRQRQNRR
jgi:hypothetical protein